MLSWAPTLSGILLAIVAELQLKVLIIWNPSASLRSAPPLSGETVWRNGRLLAPPEREGGPVGGGVGGVLQRGH